MGSKWYTLSLFESGGHVGFGAAPRRRRRQFGGGVKSTEEQPAQVVGHQMQQASRRVAHPDKAAHHAAHLPR
eukprot:scaffold58267_cov90-Phaeocystis_antarctica.AAC.3